MKKNFYVLILLLKFIQVSAQNKTTIELLEQQRYKLMIAADTSELRFMLAPSLLYYHSNCRVDTKESFLKSIATKELEHKNITVLSSSTRIYRKRTAIVTGVAVYDIVYEGKAMNLTMLYTNVYIKTHGHWLLVSRQTTKLPNT
jgi:hypothetical protein